MAEGLSYAAAAELANVSARAVRRRMADPTFTALVSGRKGQRVSEVTGVLVGLAGRAVATLQECLDVERPADRIKAAQVVLSQLRIPRIHDQTASARHNRRLAGVFKSAVQLGLVHAPPHDLAGHELLHLQERGGRVDHPTHGPVQTSDISDALLEVTHQLIGDDLDRWNRLGDLTLGMSQPGGLPSASRRPRPPTANFPNFPTRQQVWQAFAAAEKAAECPAADATGDDQIGTQIDGQRGQPRPTVATASPSRSHARAFLGWQPAA